MCAFKQVFKNNVYARSHHSTFGFLSDKISVSGSAIKCSFVKMAELKEQFDEKLNASVSQKRDNTSIPTKAKRDYWISRLLAIEEEGPKASTDYNLKRKYAVLRVGGEQEQKKLQVHFCLFF